MTSDPVARQCAACRSATQRLAGLDGVRGLAALFVVVNHIFLRAFPGYPVDRAPFWAGWFIYGRFAVVVFIVLSGFSLALSPARHGWRLDGGLPVRAPAGPAHPPGRTGPRSSSASRWRGWSSLHRGRQRPTRSRSSSTACWCRTSSARRAPTDRSGRSPSRPSCTSLFPLLLLMVRRWGAVVMVATVTLVVAAVGILGPHVSGLDTFVIQSPPDLAALFAVGILAAGIVGASGARRSWPWAWLALAAARRCSRRSGGRARCGRSTTCSGSTSRWARPSRACWPALATGHPAPLLRLLDARPLRSLGSSSYSLYLTHGPIVVVVYEQVVAGRVRQGVPAFVVSLALVVPLTIVFARVFASVFEIPFRRHRSWANLRTTGAQHGAISPR